MEAVVDTATLGTEEYPYAVYRRVFDTDRMAMSLVTVRPGASVPMHVHHDEEQVYYVLAGRGVVAIGEKRQTVGPGHAVHIPLDTQHGVSNDSPTDPLEYLYVVAFVKPGRG
jgi:mannose-6-phosphate isomerase-like protein (cupin superfamily)